MNKPKLTINEQIEDLKKKGVTFNLISENDACHYLTYDNYYFKLKSYAKNYDKYLSTSKKGQYINLDFAYLKDLSDIDSMLRKTILGISLDIEHALKVQIMRDSSINDKCDGYTIVKEYLAADYMREKFIKDKIGCSATSDLISKHADNNKDYAIWDICEVLSFGNFIDLYNLYYSTYPSSNDYSRYLWSVKFMRNAAAHENCLLNSLKAPYNVSNHKTKSVMDMISKISGISDNSRKKWLSNPVIHDFIVTVYLFLNVVKTKDAKQSGISNLDTLFHNRMPANKEYYEKNDTLKECYNFTNRAITYFCNKYRKK